MFFHPVKNKKGFVLYIRFLKELKIFSCVYSQIDTLYVSLLNFLYVSTKAKVIKMNSKHIRFIKKKPMKWNDMKKFIDKKF